MKNGKRPPKNKMRHRIITIRLATTNRTIRTIYHGITLMRIIDRMELLRVMLDMIHVSNAQKPLTKHPPNTKSEAFIVKRVSALPPPIRELIMRVLVEFILVSMLYGILDRRPVPFKVRRWNSK